MLEWSGKPKANNFGFSQVSLKTIGNDDIWNCNDFFFLNHDFETTRAVINNAYW